MSCAVCGSIENLQNHHTSYEPEIKINLCKKHYTVVHKHGSGVEKGHKNTRVLRHTSSGSGYIGEIDFGGRGFHFPKVFKQALRVHARYIIGARSVFLFDSSQEKVLEELDLIEQKFHLTPTLEDKQ